MISGMSFNFLDQLIYNYIYLFNKIFFSANTVNVSVKSGKMVAITLFDAPSFKHGLHNLFTRFLFILSVHFPISERSSTRVDISINSERSFLRYVRESIANIKRPEQTRGPSVKTTGR